MDLLYGVLYTVVDGNKTYMSVQRASIQVSLVTQVMLLVFFAKKVSSYTYTYVGTHNILS